MAQKKEPIDEQILRYIYNSKFYPEKEKSAYKYANPIMDIVGDSRSYTEARNKIIQAMKNAEMLERLRDISDYYIGEYKTEDDLWDPEKTFMGNFDLRPINADKRDIKDVLSLSEQMADALGYTGGLDAMLSNFENNNRGKSGDLLASAMEAELLKKLAENDDVKDRVYTMLDLSPVADDKYVANMIADYVGRSKKFKDYEKKNGMLKFARDFVAPFSNEKESEGRDVSAIDVLFDVVGNAGALGAGGKYAKGKRAANAVENGLNNIVNSKKIANIAKMAELGGLGVLAGVTEPIFTRMHDMAEAASSKKVYANAGLDDEWSETTSPFDEKVIRLETLIPEIGKGAYEGFLKSGAGIAGRSIGRKLLNTKIGQKVQNGFDALLGNDEKKRVKKKFDELMKEKAEDKKAVDDFWNSTKMEAELSPENLEYANRRIAQIERHEDAIRKIMEKSQKPTKAKTALDALMGYYVTKNALNPENRNKDVEKAAYMINLLNQ